MLLNSSKIIISAVALTITKESLPVFHFISELKASHLENEAPDIYDLQVNKNIKENKAKT